MMNHTVDFPPVPSIAIRRPPNAVYRPFGAFRFGLAAMVMVQHFQYLLPESDRLVFNRMGFGIIAVAVFFVISGFVVAEASQVFYRSRPLAFLTNRMLRVAPPYVAALALAIVGHLWLWRAGKLVLWDYGLSGSPVTPASVMAGLLGLLPGFRPSYMGQTFEFIPFAWSLRVEMAFYIAVAVILRLAGVWPRVVGWCFVLSLAGCFLYLPGGGASLVSDLPLFLLGVTIHQVSGKPIWLRIVTVALTGAAAAFGFASLGQHGTPNLPAQFVVLVASVAVFVCLSGLTMTPDFICFDRLFGTLSYPLYLNHYIVGIVMYDCFHERSSALQVGAMLISLVLAAVMARLVDMPMQRIRALVRGRQI